jgi:hypothetical protein
MSADSVVPHPFYSQSLNRYSYVYNNPLSFTDPTGHIETVFVTAPLYSNPVTAVVAAVVDVLSAIFGLDLFGSSAAVAPATVTVASPTPTTSPTAGGNPTGITKVQNIAVPQSRGIEQVVVHGGRVAQNSTATLTQAARFVGTASTGARTILTAKQQPNWCQGQCSIEGNGRDAFWVRGQRFELAGQPEEAVVTASREGVYNWLGTNGAQLAQSIPPIIGDPVIDSLLRPMIEGSKDMPPPPAGMPKPPGWTPKWQWRAPEGKSPASPRYFDPEGGEWRYHAQDKYHPDAHWDYNPHTEWNSPWQNLPLNMDLTPRQWNACFAAGRCT